jgi:hypothetical protein
MLRLIAAIWIATRVIGGYVGAAMLLAMAVVFVQATVYESLRTGVSGRRTRRLQSMTAGRRAILLMVGTGYAIRAGTGMGLAQRGALDWNLLAMTALTMTAFGSMFVTMTWTIDNIVLLSSRHTALPSAYYRKALKQAVHLGPLLTQAGLLRSYGDLKVDDSPEPTGEAAGELNARRSLENICGWTWWNVMFVLAGGSAAWTGAQLGGAPIGGRVEVSVAATLVAAASLRVYGSDGSNRRFVPDSPSPRRALIVVLMGTIGMAALMFPYRTAAVVLTCSLFGLVSTVYVVFRSLNRAALLVKPSDALSAAWKPLRETLVKIARAASGGAGNLLFGDPESGGAGVTRPKPRANLVRRRTARRGKAVDDERRSTSAARRSSARREFSSGDPADNDGG